jgi:hypothetical protein
MFKMARRRYIKSGEESVHKAIHRATYDQGLMIISFSLAILWVLIFPIEYQAFAYIFLGLGPILGSFKSKSARKLDPVKK